MKDQVVIHPSYGRGIVKKTLYGGAELYVRFAQGPLRCVRIDEICVDLPHLPKVQPTGNTIISAKFKSRRMIEAFRLGIVPEDCVEAFTFGREEETAKLNTWLNSSEENALALVGDYGTGKTHLLNYMRNHALQEGFAVATIEINPLESPFSKPKRVYSQLVHSLRIGLPGEELYDFRWLVQQALNANLLNAHHYFKHVKKYPYSEIVWEWIEAKEDAAKPYSPDNRYKDFPGLYGHHGNTANIYCYLLSTLGWIAKQKVIGLKGLLLVFDEAESIYASSTSTASLRSSNFLEALIATAKGAPQLLKKPSESGFDYAAHADTIPFLYKLSNGLKVLLAFTSDNSFYYSQGLNALPKLFLDPLDQDALRRLFEKICSIYSEAYGLSRTLSFDGIWDVVAEEYGPTRLLVKSYVEALDIMRFHPNADPDEVLK